MSAELDRVVTEIPTGGERREGQRQMADAVAEAIANKRHLVVQAGTGTGKTLAYLIPAIVSGKKTIVATATKALQDQLATKDLPFLEQHLGHPFTWTLLKGRSNYVCRQRVAEVSSGEDGQLDLGVEQASTSLRDEVRRLVAWAEHTEIGDRAELAVGAERGRVVGRQRRLGRVPRRTALPDGRPAVSPRTPAPAVRKPTSSWSTPTSTACTWR